MGGLVSMKKPDFIGRALAGPLRYRSRRPQTAGRPAAARSPELLPEGAQLTVPDQNGSQGHVTSSYFSAALDRTFALALLRAGRSLVGGVVQVPLLDGRSVQATVTEPVLYDASNERRDG